LAERMRPERLEDYIGQEHILGAGKPLRRQIERDELTSIILWGPPGVGKTTLAKLIARVTRCEFIPFSAVLSGIKEIKAVMVDAVLLRRMGRRTILFIDDIHRFNKAQHDALLPYLERGDIILIGATTDSPSFEVSAMLLRRCINPCGRAMWMLLFTGWPACWKPAKTECTLRGGWSACRSKISGSRIRARSNNASPRSRRCTFLVFPKAIWRWRRQRFT